MAFERNDIVNKTRLMGELGEELMGFEHNDIVTVDVMNAAIAEGGGGGDFSTATVTFTATGDTGHAALSIQHTMPDPGTGFDTISNAEVELDSAGSTSINVVLYKGHQILTITYGDYVSSTGDITYNELGFYDVTGDGTITVAMII